MLKYLIQNLDLKHIDPGNMIQLCLEFNLFTPLIYISTRVNDDFITPLNKMFQIYLVQLTKADEGEGGREEASGLPVSLVHQALFQRNSFPRSTTR